MEAPKTKNFVVFTITTKGQDTGENIVTDWSALGTFDPLANFVQCPPDSQCWGSKALLASPNPLS